MGNICKKTNYNCLLIYRMKLYFWLNVNIVFVYEVVVGFFIVVVMNIL